MARHIISQGIAVHKVTTTGVGWLRAVVAKATQRVSERGQEAKQAYLEALRSEQDHHEEGVIESRPQAIGFLIGGATPLPLYPGETFIISGSDGITSSPRRPMQGEVLAFLESAVADKCFFVRHTGTVTGLHHGEQILLAGKRFQLCGVSCEMWGRNTGGVYGN